MCVLAMWLAVRFYGYVADSHYVVTWLRVLAIRLGRMRLWPCGWPGYQRYGWLWLADSWLPKCLVGSDSFVVGC